MRAKTLSEKMEPVLRRPGMYVGESPINLLWYLSGMFDLEGIFSGGSNWRGETLILSLADRLSQTDIEKYRGYSSAVEAKLLQCVPAEGMKLICEVARELLITIENKPVP